MDIIQGVNYSRKSGVYRETHFHECNFAQKIPGTVIDASGCIFESCNLVNCSVDESNELIDCNNAQIEDIDV